MHIHNKSRMAAIAIAVTALALPFSPVTAQDGKDAGFYVSAKGGPEFLNDSTFVGIQAPDAGVPGMTGAPAIVDVEYDDGFSINGAIGYNFDDNLFFDFLRTRVELEVGYLEADVDGGAFNGGDQSFSGDISNTTISIGLYNDIVWSENQKIVPYFGSAIGIAFVDVDVAYFPNNGIATAPVFGVFGNESVFLQRSSIGLNYKANEKFDIFFEGRYTKAEDGDFERRFIAGGADGFNAEVEDDTESWGIGGGIRFKF